MQTILKTCLWMTVIFMIITGNISAKKAVERPVKTAEIADPAEGSDVRLLLFFELPEELVNTKTIVDFALLKFAAEVSGSFGGQIEIFPVTTRWDDRSDVTWEDPWGISGGDYSVEYMTSNFMLKSDIGKREITIDVTEMIRDWQSGIMLNNGIIIKLSEVDLSDMKSRCQVDKSDIELEIHYSLELKSIK